MNWCCVILALWAGVSLGDTVTPVQYLQSLPRPNFAVGYRLPPLTRWGGNLSTNTDLELAQHWGYTMELNLYASLANMTNLNAYNRTVLTLVSNNPGLKLCCMMDRNYTAPIPYDFYCTNSAGDQLKDLTGSLTVCPEGPTNYWQLISANSAAGIAVVRSNAPVAVVLNGGEYGMNVAGWAYYQWLDDPRVIAVTNQFSSYGNGWFQHWAGSRKRREALYPMTAAKSVVPNALYIYYHSGYEYYFTDASADPLHNYNDSRWGFMSDAMNAVSDYPSFELYERITATTNRDVMTRYLDAVGYNMGVSQPWNYSWLAPGWSTNNADNTDPDIYTGFLKSAYLAGMIGGISGFFSVPNGGFDASFDSSSPPSWLSQMICISRVHALFSHFENFLWNGDLLPGPYTHRISRWQPAYEFTNDYTNRVVARKLRGLNQWLVSAWAMDGATRPVTVTIPGPGIMAVSCTGTGKVYWVATTPDATNIAEVTDTSVHPTVGRLLAGSVKGSH